MSDNRIDEESLDNYNALKVYLILFDCTEEGKGITIDQIACRIKERFGVAKPTKNTINKILRNMSEKTEYSVQVAQDNRNRYYLKRNISESEIALLSEVILQSKSLSNAEKDKIGMKLNALLGSQKECKYKEYRAYGNLVNNSSGETFTHVSAISKAIVKNSKIWVFPFEGNKFKASPQEIFSRNNKLYLLYIDEESKLNYIETNDIKKITLTDAQRLEHYDSGISDWDEVMENPIAYVNGEKKERFYIDILKGDKKKAINEFKQEFGEANVFENPINNQLSVDCFYFDLEKFLFDRFENYRLIAPTKYIKKIRDQIAKMNSIYNNE